MKSVYQAAHGFDAHMVKDLLEQAGIPAQVRGEFLQGALGELPAGGMVTVWVARGDFTRAREVLLAWERSAPDAPAEAESSDSPAPALRAPRAGNRVRALVAALLLVPVLWWALVRLLG